MVHTKAMNTTYNPTPPPTPVPPQKPRKSHLATVIISILLAIIVAGAIGFWLYVKHDQERDAEERAYTALTSSYDSADYADFLDRFPNSSYRSDVRMRLRKLEAMERDWAEIRNSTSPNDFAHFKNKYTNPLYDRLCDAKIDSLDWITAQQQGNGAAISRYMRLHPDGKYLAEATEAHEQYSKNEPTASEKESVIATIHQFFNVFGNNNAEGIASLIPSLMNRFLNRTGLTREDVVNTISDMFNEHILSCDFHVGSDFRITKHMEDQLPIFTVLASVDQRIERDDEGKSAGRYTFRAEVDGNGKIRSFTMNPKEQ